jgi:hypothetical protein
MQLDEEFKQEFPQGARILRVEQPLNDGYWGGGIDDDVGRIFHLERNWFLHVAPEAGGWCHGGSFDTDGVWPEAGDILFGVEESFGKLGEIDWSAVRIMSTKGDMRAMVRDHGDDYGYGAGLAITFDQLQLDDHVREAEKRTVNARMWLEHQQRKHGYRNDNLPPQARGIITWRYRHAAGE